MKKLPDSLVEKLGNLPAEEALKMLASPDDFNNLNLTFMDFVCLSEYLTELSHTLKSADTDFSKLEKENKNLRNQLMLREARCEELEYKLNSISEVLNKEDYLCQNATMYN